MIALTWRASTDPCRQEFTGDNYAIHAGPGTQFYLVLGIGRDGLPGPAGMTRLDFTLRTLAPLRACRVRIIGAEVIYSVACQR
jgi:hypothetical protein